MDEVVTQRDRREHPVDHRHAELLLQAQMQTSQTGKAENDRLGTIGDQGAGFGDEHPLVRA